MNYTAKAKESLHPSQNLGTFSDVVNTLFHSLLSRRDWTWGKFFKSASQKLGLTTALTGAGLGLTGLGDASSNKAHAGLVISGDPNADQRAQDNGTGYSVEGGGNVGWLSGSSILGIRYSSLVFYDPYTAITTAHGVNGRNGMPETYAIGIGANFNSGPSFSPYSIITHPDYGGSAGQGIDLAVIKFKIPVNISSNLVLASNAPANGEIVWFAGYGVKGNPTDGYLGQDGAIRAGTSRANLGSPLLGGSPEFYQNALFSDRLTNPTGMRLTVGDSGGGTFSTSNELYGINVGANTSPTVGGSTFLLTSPPVVRDFILANSGPVTAVPEPSSLGLTGALVGAAALYRRYRRRRIATKYSSSPPAVPNWSVESTRLQHF